jgi:IS30 family transposase
VNDWYIVGKGFSTDGELLTHGQPVNTSGWRNVRALLEARYLRPPANEEDFRKIEKAIEETSQKDVSLEERIRQLHEEGLKPKEISLKLAEDGIEMSYQTVAKTIRGGE